MFESEEPDEPEEAIQEELSQVANFFMSRSGPTFAVEEVANGFIVRVRRIKKVPVPVHDPHADPMLPDRRPKMYDHAAYEEKYVCTKLHEVIKLLGEHFRPAEKRPNAPDGV